LKPPHRFYNFFTHFQRRPRHADVALQSIAICRSVATAFCLCQNLFAVYVRSVALLLTALFGSINLCGEAFFQMMIM